MTVEPLLPEVKRLTQGRLAWFLACLLTATFIWSYAWNPVTFLLRFTLNPPENVNGSFTMGYFVAGMAALCLLLSAVTGGVAFRDYVKPNYGVLLVLLAGVAVLFAHTGMLFYDSIPVIPVEAP